MKKKQFILLILMTLMVFVSSFAYFTDHKYLSFTANTGSFSIDANFEEGFDSELLNNLAPGKKEKVILETKLNEASNLDALIRYHVLFYFDNEELSHETDKYLNASILHNGKELTVIDGISDPHKLEVGQKEEVELVLELDKKTPNTLQNESINFEIIVEARQLDDDNRLVKWSEFTSDTIQFGKETIQVVPKVE